MRFTSNEGQNMAPDVILILIKEGAGGRGGVGMVGEHIVKYNEPFFFYYRGEQGLQGGIHARCALFPRLGDMEVSGR